MNSLLFVPWLYKTIAVSYANVMGKVYTYYGQEAFFITRVVSFCS